MKGGSKRHEKWKNRAKERQMDITRYFGVHLHSPNIGLFGILDAVDYDGKHAMPIELKTGHSSNLRISDHHRAQLMAECMLVESVLLAEVNSGILRYETKNEECKIEYNDEQRIWVFDMLSKMRNIVRQEIIPEPTSEDAKCTDCEYYAVCLKI